MMQCDHDVVPQGSCEEQQPDSNQSNTVPSTQAKYHDNDFVSQPVDDIKNGSVTDCKTQEEQTDDSMGQSVDAAEHEVSESVFSWDQYFGTDGTEDKSVVVGEQ